MDILSSVILGAVQGLTEFLPISSSGHLIIARDLLGLQTDYGLSVDAVLQLATSLAIFIYFRREFGGMIITFFNLVRGRFVEKRDAVLFWAVVFGTIPAVAFGLLLENAMDTIFRNTSLVAFSLLTGSLLFYLGERFAKQDSILTPQKGLWIGFFQSLALIPGMSRSGSTIAGGLLLGLTREEAARFGFIVGFPILLGSGLKKLIELQSQGILLNIGFSVFVGAVCAFVVSMFVIHYLLRYLRSHTLSVFIWYRVLFALILLSLPF
ncbi:MAG TPA: undecaprenyl-diphosphatase UppP [Candidatus Paceibacterota bacterium]